MTSAAQPPRGPATARRPVSRQRYAVRRLGAVTAIVLLAFGAFRVVGSLTEPEAAGEEPPSSSAVGPTGAAGAAITTGAAPESTSATPTAPSITNSPNTGPPTADNPANVLVMGDSDAGVFGPYLDGILADTGLVDVELDYVSSTGLARPDAYDWPAHMRETLAASEPEIIVVTFGGNDAQALTEPCPGAAGTCGIEAVVGVPSAANVDEWTAEYVRRVNEVMAIMLEDAERTVIWVGIPNAVEEEFTQRLRIQDRAVRQALQSYPNAVFVDTWDRFDGRNGGIAELVVDPRDGVAKPVRQSDGFHLNEDGAEILAIDIAEHVEAALRELGADL